MLESHETLFLHGKNVGYPEVRLGRWSLTGHEHPPCRAKCPHRCLNRSRRSHTYRRDGPKGLHYLPAPPCWPACRHTELRLSADVRFAAGFSFRNTTVVERTWTAIGGSFRARQGSRGADQAPYSQFWVRLEVPLAADVRNRAVFSFGMTTVQATSLQTNKPLKHE